MSVIGAIRHAMLCSALYRGRKNSISPECICFSLSQDVPLTGFYADLLQMWVAKREDRITLAVRAGQKTVANRTLSGCGIRVVSFGSGAHLRALMRAAYVIQDGALPTEYIKSDEQTAVTLIDASWSEDRIQEIKRIPVGALFQRTLFLSDYLIAANQKISQRIIDAFSLRGLYQGSISEVEFDEGSAQTVFSHITSGASVLPARKLGNAIRKVLLYAGAPAQNGITTSAKNCLRFADRKEQEFWFAYDWEGMREHPEWIDNVPENESVLAFSGDKCVTLLEALVSAVYYKGNYDSDWVQRILTRYYKRELRRYFCGMPFDVVIEFSGYEKLMIAMFPYLDAKSVIFVHNDMQQELAQKTNQHRLTLYHAYRVYDKVAVVTEQLIEPTAAISGRKDNIFVSENYIDVDGIRVRASQEIQPDPYTKITCSDAEGISGFLEHHEPNIITMGRFSVEKAHERLIEAFEYYAEKFPKAGLIIIGGDGILYEQTVNRVQRSRVAESIVLIKNISNPMPILAKSDLFILASLYEGLGLTLIEADCLGVPNVGTEVMGISGFRRKYKGKMVPNTLQGVQEALEAYSRGEVGTMQIDYEEYNRICKKQFEELLTFDA